MNFSETEQQILAKLRESVSNWMKQEGSARSTLAGAVVVIDMLRRQAPFTRDDIFTTGGQLTGGRGVALRETLARYGEERVFLADGVTTRSTLKFIHLAEALDWGRRLETWSSEKREFAARELVALVMEQIEEYFARKQMNLRLDRRESPSAWIEDLLEAAKERSQGRVEQHLVGAKLQRRIPGKDISGHAAFAADVQTERAGDFVVNKIVFHVTATPAMPVIRKCEENVRQGLRPVLVSPRNMVERAKVLASVSPGLDRCISFVAIEDFVATNIIELAGSEDSSFFEILESILALYNQRIVQSETDNSLRIDLG